MWHARPAETPMGILTQSFRRPRSTSLAGLVLMQRSRSNWEGSDGA